MAAHPLESIIQRFRYKDGWTMALSSAGAHGPVRQLIVEVATVNSLDRQQSITVRHVVTVPPPWGNDTEGFWRRWLLEQLILIETHEACEFFEIDQTLPFFPDHTNPYRITEHEKPPSSRPFTPEDRGVRCQRTAPPGWPRGW